MLVGVGIGVGDGAGSFVGSGVTVGVDSISLSRVKRSVVLSVTTFLSQAIVILETVNINVKRN